MSGFSNMLMHRQNEQRSVEKTPSHFLFTCIDLIQIWLHVRMQGCFKGVWRCCWCAWTVQPSIRKQKHALSREKCNQQNYFMDFCVCTLEERNLREIYEFNGGLRVHFGSKNWISFGLGGSRQNILTGTARKPEPQKVLKHMSNDAAGCPSLSRISQWSRNQFYSNKLRNCSWEGCSLLLDRD